MRSANLKLKLINQSVDCNARTARYNQMLQESLSVLFLRNRKFSSETIDLGPGSTRQLTIGLYRIGNIKARC